MVFNNAGLQGEAKRGCLSGELPCSSTGLLLRAFRTSRAWGFGASIGKVVLSSAVPPLSWHPCRHSTSRFLSGTLLPFYLRVPSLKPNSKEKGTLIIMGLPLWAIRP